MNKPRSERVPIDLLSKIRELVPTYKDDGEDWNVKIFDRSEKSCGNYISPTRREFYEILLITGCGNGIYTLGANSYEITSSAIIFVHPNEIVSWRNLSDKVSGYYCLFKKEFVDNFPQLKVTIDKHQVFTDKNMNLVSLSEEKTAVLNSYFISMLNEQGSDRAFNIEAIQIYLQLIILEVIRDADLNTPHIPSTEFGYLEHFFQLLEKEISSVNFEIPLRIKTAKEFAENIGVHPNYLNQLLKSGTGKNVSVTIRDRIISAAKTFLLQTDWTLNQIGYSLGFEEQSNFNAFFKRYTGFTPGDFQKNRRVI